MNTNTIIRTDIGLSDVRVTRKGGTHNYQIVMDKTNFLAFRQSPSYGSFEGDYHVLIKGFHINPLNDHSLSLPRTPLSSLPASQTK